MGKQKKIMILGGGKMQMPLIEQAKALGYKTIVVDYHEQLPNMENIDVHYPISTLDFDAVLKVAEKEEIDGIISNSEPAMETVSYVGNSLHLISNPLESVRILLSKIRFRNFLHKVGLPSPKSAEFEQLEEIHTFCSHCKFPLAVKPAESSGSRGFAKVETEEELAKAFVIAKEYSRNKKVVIEEYLDILPSNFIEADIIVNNGAYVDGAIFSGYRDKERNYHLPLGNIFPCLHPDTIVDRCISSMKTVIEELHLVNGEFNVEMALHNDQVYIIEMNPRQGGNYIPRQIEWMTDRDFTRFLVESCVHSNVEYTPIKQEKYWFTYMPILERDGVFQKITIADQIQSHVKEMILYKEAGESVKCYKNAEDYIGVVLFEFDSEKKRREYIHNINQLIEVEILNNMEALSSARGKH